METNTTPPNQILDMLERAIVAEYGVEQPTGYDFHVNPDGTGEARNKSVLDQLHSQLCKNEVEPAFSIVYDVIDEQPQTVTMKFRKPKGCQSNGEWTEQDLKEFRRQAEAWEDRELLPAEGFLDLGFAQAWFGHLDAARLTWQQGQARAQPGSDISRKLQKYLKDFPVPTDPPLLILGRTLAARALELANLAASGLPERVKLD